MYNVYKITLRGYNGHYAVVTAKTPSKAKYQHFLELDGIFDDFCSYLSRVESCVKIGECRFSSEGTRQEEDFTRTARYRGVPNAKIGMAVELNGKRGYILRSNDSANFDVAFDSGVFNCHPNHELVYFDQDGSILYDFRRTSKMEV